MVKLFKREVALTIGLKNGLGKKYTNVKIDFDIYKSLKKKPNKSTIKIYNLSKESMSDFELVDDLYCILEVGYDGNFGVLFEGEVKDVFISTEREDTIMTLFIKDGHSAVNNTISNKVFKKNTDIKKIINEIIEDMKTTGKIIVSELANTAISTLRGKENTQSVLVGKSGDLLEKYLNKYNKTYSIQNNRIEIIDKEGTTGETAALLTPGTGLLGSPVLATKKKKKFLKIKALIQTNRFVPGAIVTVKSEFVEGQFRIETVKLSGSNRDNKFEAEMQLA